MAWNPEANDVFLKALEAPSRDERAAFLEQRCGDNAELRSQVQSLLEASERAGSFLETPVVQHDNAGVEGDTCAGATSGAAHAADDHLLDFLSPTEKPDSLGRLGHYEVLEVIGRGGMGIVLRAFDEKLHRVVAIKVMAPQLAANGAARQRFEREARAAAAVRDEHVISIHAVAEENGLPYLVMEFIEGVSLQQRLDQAGPLAMERIIRIALQVARGLAAAHAHGLVHRDIKPANILLENGVERVKITDFGLARAVDDASLTQSGVVAGTPQYMAPEQARGEPTDHRADLFSFGSVLYAMCTGHPPFRATGSMAVLKRVCDDTPRPVREITPETPGWLASLIAKLHAKDPAERFQSAAEVAELLSQHLGRSQQTSVVGQVSDLPLDPKAGWKPAPRGRRVAVAAAVLLCLIGVVSLGEATGVTQLVPTMIRIFSPEVRREKASADAPLSDEEKLEQARQQLEEADKLQKLGEPLRGPDPWQAELHYRKAVAIYEKLAQDFPESPASNRKLEACRWGLSSALNMRAGNTVLKSPPATLEEWQRAVVMATEAVALSPAEKGFWVTLGIAQGRTGDWKAARETLEKADRIPMRNSQVFHEIRTQFPLAITYWQLGDKAKARERYQQAVELMEKHPPTITTELRRLQAEAGKLLGIEIPKNPGAADAKLLAELAGYDATLKENPNDLATLLKRGNVLHQLKRFDDAVAAFSQVILSTSDQAERASALINRAVAHSELGNMQNAIDDYKEFVRLTPDTGAWIIGRIATIYSFGPEKLRNPKRALEYAETAIQKRGAHAGYHTLHGVCLYRQGRHREAIEVLERAYEDIAKNKDGQTALNRFFAAMTYQSLDEPVKARACYAQARKLPVPLVSHPGLNPNLGEELRAEVEAVLKIPSKK